MTGPGRYAVPLVASIFLHGGLVGLLFALPGPGRDEKPLPPMELSEKKPQEPEKKKEPEPEPKKAAPVKVAAAKKQKRRRVRRPRKPQQEQPEPAKTETPEPQDTGPVIFGHKFKGTTSAAPGTGVEVPRGDSLAVDPRTRKRGKKPKKKGFKKVYQKGEAAPMAVLTTRPSLIKNVEAVYPERVKDLGIEGRVKLRLTINHKGKVVKVKLLRSLHPKLDEVAMKAARKLLFSPATVNRVPVTHVITYTFTFTLD